MIGDDVSSVELQLQQLRVEATRLNEKGRALRQQHAPQADIEAATASLMAVREEVTKLEQQLKQLQGYKAPSFIKYKQQCENLIRRKFFVVPAFEIYGGAGGLYDLGPPGTP